MLARMIEEMADQDSRMTACPLWVVFDRRYPQAHSVKTVFLTYKECEQFISNNSDLDLTYYVCSGEDSLGINLLIKNAVKTVNKEKTISQKIMDKLTNVYHILTRKEINL